MGRGQASGANIGAILCVQELKSLEDCEVQRQALVENFVEDLLSIERRAIDIRVEQKVRGGRDQAVFASLADIGEICQVALVRAKHRMYDENGMHGMRVQ